MKDHQLGVLLFTADHEITANMVEALLKDNGIPVLRKYRGSGLHMKIILGDTIHGIDLYVPELAYERAKELLDMLLNAEPVVDETWEESESETESSAE